MSDSGDILYYFRVVAVVFLTDRSSRSRVSLVSCFQFALKLRDVCKWKSVETRACRASRAEKADKLKDK